MLIPSRWGAISRGAVIKGLSTSVEDETVTNFISKLSYGVKHSTIFNHSEHTFRDRYHCPVKKIDMAKDQFTWYLKRVCISVQKGLVELEARYSHWLRNC